MNTSSTSKALALVGGAVLISAATNAVVTTSGGYGTPQSWLVISAAVAVICGSIAIPGASWGWRFVLVLGLVAGEAYAMNATAERTLAARDANQAPILAATKAREEAAARIKAAEAAKAEATRAITEKAALKDCAKNCRILLETAKAEAESELDAARDALGLLPPVASASPVADRLGIDPTAYDLAVAALASLAANGLGGVLIAFGAHGASQRRREHELSGADRPPVIQIIGRDVPDVPAELPEDVDLPALRKAFFSPDPDGPPKGPGRRRRSKGPPKTSANRPAAPNGSNVIPLRRADKRAQALLAIRAEIAAGRTFPRQADLCERFGIAPSSLSDWLREWEATGAIPPRRIVGRCKAVG